MRDAEDYDQRICQHCLTLGLSSTVRHKANEILAQARTSQDVIDRYSVSERIGGAVYSASLLCNEIAGLQAIADAVDANIQRIRDCASAQFRVLGIGR